MRLEYFGTEGVTPDDLGYADSRFGDVQAAIFANPYQPLWGASDARSLPCYKMTTRSLLSGLLPGGPPYQFLAATKRAVDSHADLRWGAGQEGYSRLLHPNGICLTGLWEISAPTPYSGYFRQGSRALTIARYSTCCSDTRRGHIRSLSLVGKLFPTTDPNHAEPLRTANFVTQQDIGGDTTDFINDVEKRNAGDVTALRRGSGIWGFLVTGVLFNRIDARPEVRQLYEVAELGKPPYESTCTPKIHAAAGRCRAAAHYQLDFRDEIMAQIYDRGDPTPKRKLVFRIELPKTVKAAGFRHACAGISEVCGISALSHSTVPSLHIMATT
jgi:hypothetical protein